MKKIISLCLACVLTLGLISVNFAAELPNSKKINIYYPNGDWRYVETSINLPKDVENIFIHALQQLIANANMPQGCYDELPDNIQINSFRIEDKTAYVDMNLDFIQELDENIYSIFVIKDIISYNIFNLGDIDKIIYSFDNDRIDEFSTSEKSQYIDSNTDLLSQKQRKIKKEIAFNRFREFESIKSTNISTSPYTPNFSNSKSINSTNIVTTSYYPSVSTIVIDPGHGGSDVGTYGEINGDVFYEDDLNLIVANKLKTKLQNEGYTVLMTRTTDTYVSLSSRYNYANNNNADVFISVHHNGSTNSSMYGTSCIYPNNHDITWSQDLAQWVHTAVLFYSDLDEWTAPYKDNRNLAVLRGTNMPAIITETGFMTNDDDLIYLCSGSNGTYKIATGICRGISTWDMYGEY